MALMSSDGSVVINRVHVVIIEADVVKMDGHVVIMSIHVVKVYIWKFLIK